MSVAIRLCLVPDFAVVRGRGLLRVLVIIATPSAEGGTRCLVRESPGHLRGDHGGGRDEREEVDGSGHVRGWMRRPEVRRARSNVFGRGKRLFIKRAFPS